MKIALIGYGKMGRAIEAIALQRGHTIVAKIDTKDPIDELVEKELDIAIEFTQPSSAIDNLIFCLNNNIPVITGTTGWLDQLDEVLAICEKQNGTLLYASNFSIGVNLFFELNEWLAGKMTQLDFVPRITEVHHTEKKDSPSGTAITLADGILDHQPNLEGWKNEKNTDHKNLSIVSVREPNVPGTHTVSYASKHETIEIKHKANDRSVFAEGAIEVAEWIYKKEGFFTMSDFINRN